MAQNRLCRLQTSGRVPGAAVSAAVDFLIPGLEGLHFVAYGSSQGSVVVACARQVRRRATVQDRFALAELPVITWQVGGGRQHCTWALHMGTTAGPRHPPVLACIHAAGPDWQHAGQL